MKKHLIYATLLLASVTTLSSSAEIKAINSCQRVGTVNAILYSDYCYNFQTGNSLKCADAKRMSDRPTPFIPKDYHVSYQIYYYHPDGTISSHFKELVAGKLTSICLISFAPDDPTADKSVGLNATYTGTLSTYGAPKISDSSITIVVMPVVSKDSAHWSDLAYFCKNADASPIVTAADLCDESNGSHHLLIQ